MGLKEAKLRPLVVLVAVALVALGYLLSLGNASADPTIAKYPGADCSAVACPVCSVASSNVQLDASTQNIEYFLALWNKWLASQVKGYNPGAHGITEPKYRGHKVQFFYNEMLTAKAHGLVVRNICEVGTYAGNSANFWLLAFHDAHLYTFDKFRPGTASNPGLGDTATKMLTALGRTTFVQGYTQESVPRFIKNNPAVKCDILFIDGSKRLEDRLHDLNNFRKISHKDTLMLIDDIESEQCVRGHNCPEAVLANSGTAQTAIRQNVQKGELDILRCLQTDDKPEYPKDDIVCSARYTHSG